MRFVYRSAVVVTTAAAAFALLPPAAQADWPAPNGSCRGSFELQTLNPIDPTYNPNSPAHKDRNADGWLCYNGHAWKDNNR